MPWLPGDRVARTASRHDRHILYLHGGGYVTGWPGLCRDLTWRLATLCRVCVLSIDYRLAPQHPFPAAPPAAVAASRRLLAQGADPQRIPPMGGSAGARPVSPPLPPARPPRCRPPAPPRPAA